MARWRSRLEGCPRPGVSVLSSGLPRLALLPALLLVAAAAPTEASRCQAVTTIGVRDEALAATLQADGKILVAGYSNDGTSDNFALVRYLPTGHLDTTFGTGGIVTTPINAGNEQAIAIALQADGKIVLAGFSDVGGGNNDFALVRYNTNGTLDTAGFNPTGTFGGAPNAAGMVTTAISGADDQARGVAIQADGKIVAAGWSGAIGSRNISVVRYNTNGSLDTAGFNSTGTVGGAPNAPGMVTTAIGAADDEGWSVGIQPSDGRIVVVGEAALVATGRDMALVRFNTNGSYDGGFGTGGIVTIDFGSGDQHARGVRFRASDNKIVAGGSHNPGVFDFAAVRRTTTGGVDAAFGTGGFVTTDLGGGGHDIGQAMTLQTDEKVLVAGWSHNGTNWDFGLVRYSANGVQDPTFGAGGIVRTPIGSGNDLGQAVLVQTDGRIVVAGSSFLGSDLHFAWTRYNANGTPDVSCPAVDEMHYRWRRDNGTESTAWYLKPEDTKILGLGKNIPVRLRFEVSTEGTLSSGPTSYQLQVAESASCPSSAPVLGAQTLAGGAYHTCVRLNSGEIQCWGHNGEGEVGDGTNTDPRPSPLTVSGLTDATQVTAGAYHTCAAFPSGAVDCWGANFFGALGDGTTTDRWTPVPVPGISTAQQVGGGAYHTCARLASGGVQCWGYNSNGQIGDNSTTERHSPVSVSGMTDAVQITTGDYHTCALRATGAVACWGYNSDGQIGDNTTTERHTPVPVSGLSGTAAVSAGGYHTCALTTSGTVSCWGDNARGQIGDNTTTDRHLPVTVTGLSGVVQVAAGEFHTCALLGTGSVKCWGRNDEGQLGDGTTTQRNSPASVSGITNAVEVATGWYHTCAVLATGEVACWGDNSNGQLGDGTTGGTATTPTSWTPSSGPTLPYEAVPTDTSGHWQITDSSYFADGDPSTDIVSGLTNESTTFVAGQLKDASNSTGAIALAPDQFTEIEFALQATANATDSGDYCFRLYDATSNYVLGNYPVYAEVQLASTTAVTLQSFEALPSDSAVDLVWQTASELDNLGFHLYRSLSESGPWTRITPSLIPGLGSSPTGATYSWRDTGLANGTGYFYRLEDVDTSSVSTFHGPVFAVPQAGLAGGDDSTGGDPDPGGSGSGGSSGEDGDPGDAGPRLPACSSPEPTPPCVETFGDPSDVSVRVVRRSRHHAVLELRTGGFEVVHEENGRVWARIRGFEDPDDPRAPALPFKRVVLDARVGRGARVAWVKARQVERHPGVVPSAVGYREMDVRADGTVRPARRTARLRDLPRGVVPRRAVRLEGAEFLGEKKLLTVDLFPLRLEGSRGAVTLARRLRVRVDFSGREALESGSGSRGRRLPRTRPGGGETLAFLHTARRGLHGVAFEDLFAGRTRPVSLDLLKLQRQGETVPFHVEPGGSAFGPGSVLYFYVERAPRSTSYVGEVVYELVRAGGGQSFAEVSASPSGHPVTIPSLGTAAFETNRIYQSGLLEAEDRWLWENLVGGVSKSRAFDLVGVDAASARPGRIGVWLQGGSDADGVSDHHVQVFVNGTFVGETTFDGKRTQRFEADVPAAVFQEGTNALTLRNAGDTGVYSLVFLDRFEVRYPQTSVLRGGAFDAEWSEGGIARISASASPIAVLDVSDPGRPAWGVGMEPGAGSVSLRVEPGRHYLLVTPDGVLSPRVSAPVPTSLKSTRHQADYILIAPRAFLPAAHALLERRQSQGLRTMAASLEEIASAFGHGEASGEAIRSFLTFAYHSWQAPSPRYVLLLGDASHDPRNFIGSSAPAPLPALFLKTSYLVTASDPALAAVNGEDLLPDLAIGRLPVQTAQEAEALIGKILAWEDSGQGLSGRTVLVADNPDEAGDFEWDVDDLAARVLSGRETLKIFLSREGANTRSRILAAFDEGASFMSYVGHGGAAVWATENVLNSWDVASLQAQSTQSVMLTMNCLNGYFVAPAFDSLGEAYLKVPGRGTIAAFSPSGLSVDFPAHQLHLRLMRELTAGHHERLGDAILAAQQAYAETGLMPELLDIYHLLGDPATKIR